MYTEYYKSTTPSKEFIFGAYHFGCRVEHLHLLQDGGTVAGDDNVTLFILNLKTEN